MMTSLAISLLLLGTNFRVDLNELPRISDTEIFAAVRSDDIELVTKLIQSGAVVNARDTSARTPLFYVRSGKMVKLLTKMGATVDARSDTGATPLLEIAMTWGKTMPTMGIEPGDNQWWLLDVMGELVAAGASLEATQKSGANLPVYLGMNRWLAGYLVGFRRARSGSFESSMPQSETQASFDSALRAAILADDVWQVRRALQNGANPNAHVADHSATGQETATYPVVFAINPRYPEILRLMVVAGADPNSQHLGVYLVDRLARTPHMGGNLPTVEDNIAAVRMLALAGANITPDRFRPARNGEYLIEEPTSREIERLRRIITD